MALARLGKIGIIFIASLLISACGANIHGQQEKIAFVNWQQAVESHPQYESLFKGEKILEDLVTKRKKQEELARAQLGSLQKLRSLRQLSQQSYFHADLNTRLVEQRERENAKLQKFVTATEAEVEKEIAPQRQQLEESYQLQLFNLRAVLESVKMKPAERQKVEERLQQVQYERSLHLFELEKQKNEQIAAKVKPYMNEMQQQMDELAKQYYQEMYSQLENREQKDRELLSDAPKALNNAISIMDKEIDKQQEKNDKLRNQIKSDIESQAIKLAHERGYTIIFNQVKVNVKADDITNDVIKNLKLK